MIRDAAARDFEPRLIVVAAPSGGGKSTILARVFAAVDGLTFSISHTTRRPRLGEQDGREYHFVDEGAFRKLVASDAFLEWAEVHGRLYGTASSEVDRARALRKDLVLDIDVQGAEQVRRRRPDAVSIFFMPPSLEVLEDRLTRRGSDSGESLSTRLANAKIEIARAHEFQHIIVNDTLDHAVEQTIAIIRASRGES